ncbi:MAG: hypothetical protein MOIL_01522 [Candidatus Methanolliviera sp. GoM_oil]|nr:MAG: hypothetical protein MOIL_01522 [Candidatus Methanolliviera sp. GoM_oil]
MRIKIKVIANARKDEVIEGDPLIVKTKEPPIKGKANKAVVKLLSKYFNAKVRIISGEKRKEKWIEVEERNSR